MVVPETTAGRPLERWNSGIRHVTVPDCALALSQRDELFLAETLNPKAGEVVDLTLDRSYIRSIARLGLAAHCIRPC